MLTNLYAYVNDKPITLVDRAGPEGDPPNILDVITYEVRQAAFEAGKALETGKVTAKLTGDVCLPPPKGQAVFDTIAEDRCWRLGYGTAQGNTASTILRENLKESSATALWGESSQNWCPSLVLMKASFCPSERIRVVSLLGRAR
jgi:hypothetical protein